VSKGQAQAGANNQVEQSEPFFKPYTTVDYL